MARILLVDDDHDIRKFGLALLASAGHEAFAADGTLGALDFLNHNSVDLLITDANMPQHSGFDLVRTVTKDPRFVHLSIAMLTGLRERKDIQRALDCGVHDYIVKPLDPMLFIKKVTDLLERRPPAERPEVNFATLNMSSAATLSTNVEIISLSELGMTIRSPHLFREGARIELGSDLFFLIGIEPPLLKVISSVDRDDEGRIFGCETKINFVGADEKSLTKIRAWVHANTVKNARAA